jgi:hypothetical protein
MSGAHLVPAADRNNLTPSRDAAVKIESVGGNAFF